MASVLRRCDASRAVVAGGGRGTTVAVAAVAVAVATAFQQFSARSQSARQLQLQTNVIGPPLSDVVQCSGSSQHHLLQSAAHASTTPHITVQLYTVSLLSCDIVCEPRSRKCRRRWHLFESFAARSLVAVLVCANCERVKNRFVGRFVIAFD